MHKPFVTAVLLGACLLSAGCAHVRSAMHNAASDAMDVARFDLSFSAGTDMGAHAMATQYVQLKSYSYEDLYRFGFTARHAGLWEEEREGWWIGPVHSDDFRVHMESVWLTSTDLPAAAKSSRYFARSLVMESPDEVGLGGHLFFAGMRFGLRPFELADLAANLIGADPADDNLTLAERRALRRLKEPRGPVKEGTAEAEEG